MHTILQERVNDGSILLWEPQLPGNSCNRTLFITREINEEFAEENWNEPTLAQRYGQLTADFDRYATGETLPVGMEPYDKDDDAFMARVDPVGYGIWTIRSVAPRPAIRVFGAFCGQDTFIALLTRKRAVLGGRGSREWANAREAAIQRWDGLFVGRNRLVGDTLNVYFSEKAISV
jgi:hypothetical protein